MTKQELMARMEALSEEMRSVGVEVENFFGMRGAAKHGRELFGAGLMLKTWVEGMEAEE